MSLVTGFIIEKLPYITIFIFIVGVFWRIKRWLNGPKDSTKIKIDPTASIKYVLLDIVLFRKQFKSNKLTWLLIFIFHGCIAAIMFGHMRGFYWWNTSMLAIFGPDFVTFMVEILPVYVGYIFIITQIFLLLRRMSFEGKKLISLPEDYLVLLLLLATSILGQGTRVIPPERIPPEIFDVTFIPNFIVLHLEKVPNDLWFTLHALTTQLLVMYIPFSKLVHVVSGVITSAIYGSRRHEYGV